METIINKLAGGQFELSGMNVAGFMSIKETQSKAIDLVRLLLDKEVAKKVRKMGEGDMIEFNLSSVLSDLVVTATGSLTRADVEKIFEAKSDELVALFLASKNISIENYKYFPEDKKIKVSAAVSTMVDRVLTAVCAKASNAVGKMSASETDLQIVGSLSDLPEVLQAKIAECLEAIDLF